MWSNQRVILIHFYVCRFTDRTMIPGLLSWLKVPFRLERCLLGLRWWWSDILVQHQFPLVRNLLPSTPNTIKTDHTVLVRCENHRLSNIGLKSPFLDLFRGDFITVFFWGGEGGGYHTSVIKTLIRNKNTRYAPRSTSFLRYGIHENVDNTY